MNSMYWGFAILILLFILRKILIMAKTVQLQSPNRPRTTIGQMRQQVIIQTFGDSPFGDHDLNRTYVNVATARARVDNISGSASREGKGIDANITHTVLIRKPDFELTTENMLEWIHPETNERLRIRQVRPVGKTSIDPRQQFLMLLCESQGLVEAFKDPSIDPPPEPPPELGDPIAIVAVTAQESQDELLMRGDDYEGKMAFTLGGVPNRYIRWETDGVLRWEARVNDAAEYYNDADTDVPPENGWVYFKGLDLGELTIYRVY